MSRVFKLLILCLCVLPFLVNAKTIIRYDIVGLQGAPLKNVQTALSSAKEALFKRIEQPTNEDIQRLFSHSSDLMNEALQPYGYFSPSVHSYLKKNGEQWTFHYQINPGPSVNLAQINLSVEGPGENNPVFKQWMTQFPLKIGSVFNSDDYKTAKQSFFTVANQNGYIKAKLRKHSVEINMNNYNAYVNLHYVTGTQYFFGPLQFSKTALRRAFLLRYFDIESGKPYSLPQLLQAQQNLSNSGYFSDVTVEPVNKAVKNNQIPIKIKLRQLKKMRYTVGAGYGTDTGFRGQLGWDWRLINPSGHHLQAQYDQSQIGNNIGLNYYIPGMHPLTEQYTLSANSAYYKTDAGKSRLQNFGVNYTHSDKRWQTRYGIYYQLEKYQLQQEEEQTAHLLMPSVTVTYIYTNDALRPDYGTHVSINLRGALREAFSDVTFSQIQLRYRQLFPLSYRNRIFARINVGAIETNEFDELPLSLRFTAGGSQSVRGYSYQDLGPGKYLLVGSLEYQYRVTGNWFAAYFQDTGNAFNLANKPQLKRSQGLGVVWQSPIGTMELDYAKSLTDPDKGAMIQFSMGGLL